MLMSLICCYNNKNVLDEFVIASLQKSMNTDYEFIDIDNRDNRFSSIAKAYNYGLSKAHGEWIMFCHQDIAFESDFLDKISSFLENETEKRDRIYGFAGIEKSGVVYSNIQRKDSKKYIIRRQLTEPTYVFSLDECCFIISRDYIDELGGFDENACDNWHMYCVELCVRCLQQGGNVICIPETIYHKTGSSDTSVLLDSDFLKTFYKVAKKYREDYPVLYAPCYISKTNTPFLEIQLLKTYFKYLMKKKKSI